MLSSELEMQSRVVVRKTATTLLVLPGFSIAVDELLA
jgi:hypothetical protein